jgi:hypothetical protein
MAWLTADEVASKQQRQQPWEQLQKQPPGLFEEEVSSAATSSPADSCESSVAADSPTARREREEEDVDESVDSDAALPYYANQLTREEEEVLMGVVLKTVAGPMDATGELYIRMCKAFNVRAMDQVCRPLV